jgi:NADPH-dependent 2,4-dienoyl-CoA reductase/sulfur reductase-like enzyme
MKSNYELLIIGAGPTGMEAACAAAKHGVDVCVIDEQPEPGGQIYRNAEKVSDKIGAILGKDYRVGKSLVEEFRSFGGDYFSVSSVWYLDGDHQVGILRNGESYFIQPEYLLIATGAQERAMPIPGWQQPGVMYAGAGQILLKSSGLLPQGKVVLAGSGPLLLLMAAQYLAAGVKVEAILDTMPEGRMLQSIRSLISALRSFEYLIKGLGLLWKIRSAGIPYYTEVEGLRVEGDSKLDSVHFTQAKKGLGYIAGGEIRADHLLLHQGVIPNIRLPLAADCAVAWSDQQQCWTVKTDQHGESENKSKTYVVGDCARISGAMASRLQGRLSGAHIALRAGKMAQDQFSSMSRKLLDSVKRHEAIRPWLDYVYGPTAEYLVPQSDDTIVCRCEEVTAKQVREAVALGCVGPNQVKSFTRCGMGPCQGAQCSHTLAYIIADQLDHPLAEVGLLRVRPPFTPITLGQLADI